MLERVQLGAGERAGAAGAALIDQHHVAPGAIGDAIGEIEGGAVGRGQAGSAFQIEEGRESDRPRRRQDDDVERDPAPVRPRPILRHLNRPAARLSDRRLAVVRHEAGRGREQRQGREQVHTVIFPSITVTH